MNAIQGPKIMDINITQANDINIIRSHDGVNQWLDSNTLSNSYPAIAGYATVYSNMAVSLLDKDFLYVRRDGENANAMTAIDYLTANYDEQASRVTSNAPNNSMYHYPFVFSNYTLDPAIRPLCIEPILKWYWTTYTAPSSNPPQVSVLKLSDLNTNIQTNTLFPGALVPFPSKAIAVNCSSMSSTTLGKLYKLSPYIIDVSNTYTGLYNAVTSSHFDADIALALDHTLTSQDIEFGLFLASLHLPSSAPNTTVTFNLFNYKYDPVEAIFSYFSTKKYEFTDNTLNNIALNSNFAKQIILSNRIGLTYLIQQAAKQMKIWLTPKPCLDNGTYTANALINSLCFNTDMDITQLYNTNFYALYPLWIPYEYVKSSNDTLEFDKTQWVSGRGNRKIAKSVVKPRSFSDSNVSSPVYYNKFGQSITYYGNRSKCYPISIYVPNLPDRCIYTCQNWNDDNLLESYYLEESDYFPVQDLDINI